MATIEDQKQLETPETPLFLFDCTLPSGEVYRWSTHRVHYGGSLYAARILKHNLFELRSASSDATDGVSQVSITLGNADSFYSPVERTIGWKGAQLTIQFLFMNLFTGVAATDVRVLFRGSANPPDESTESYLRLSFSNRLNLQRLFLPATRIQKRCPWTFPTTAAQLTEAIDGGAKGIYSPFYRCGYSAGVPGGVGTLNAGAPFTSCDYSRAQCVQRGMFDTDSSGNSTRRFGGIEFVPASILVRSYGEKGSHASLTLDNQARYNDCIPLVYGTGWYYPPIVFARNDGNLTHTEVLLGAGEMTAVVKVIVNGVEIPEGVAGANMTATGWYNVVTLGARTGAFNLDFVDTTGKPVGDPYGSLACLSVVVPNRISNGNSLPEIQVLAQGLRVRRFDSTGAALDVVFSNNPAWVMLDVLSRSGWTTADLDLPSFAHVAQRCDQLVTALDLNGNSTLIPRFQCNLILTGRRSAADIVRGIRTNAQVYLITNSNGLLQLRAEDSLALQQPIVPLGSNSTESLAGGWPAYEFGDNLFSGILRRENGQASFRTSSRTSADSPNLFTLEFQDEFNEYQQDSVSLTSLDDSLRTSQEISASITALGVPNFDQATRITSLQLKKSVSGNTYVDFDTSVRAVDLRPGDLITITYSKEGWDRQPFRITRIAPGSNYRIASITAQIHDDSWYNLSGAGGSGSGRQPGADVGLPRPLVGSTLDAHGVAQFSISESTVQTSDGGVYLQLSAGFVNPGKVQTSGTGMPLVGLNAQVATTGGTLSGGQTLYYAVTGVDSSGAETALSFVVKATVPAGVNTNQVTLPNLSFPASAASFNVYRGITPAQLLQIAGRVPIAGQYIDTGAAPTLVSPPDMNYDHANFYWRLELQPEEGVDTYSALTIGNSTLHMLANEYTGATVRITRGNGAGQERTVLGNTASTITITQSWNVPPDSTSYFVVSDSAWQFGATGVSSPIAFEIPNRAGTTVQISGRSANALNAESAYELNPLTRWQIIGDGSNASDSDVPPTPIFGLSPVGQGTVEVQAISFPTFVDTRTISAGTLTFWYWDETGGLTYLGLAGAVDDQGTVVTLNTAVSANVGDLIQIESEIVMVQQASTGTLVTVQRGAYGTVASAHNTATAIYNLAKKVFVMPFARGFFGSLASGSYAYPVYLPDARVAAAELFMTNSQGNSNVARKSFTNTLSQGLRTLSGGQLSIQVEGMLAIQRNAAPPLAIDATHSVNYVSASVNTAPTGSPVQLRVTSGGAPYCDLTIPVGATSSESVDGFLLGPLLATQPIGLDIVSVSQTSNTVPGADLTVTIRL
jgi:hypothetical protein